MKNEGEKFLLISAETGLFLHLTAETRPKRNRIKLVVPLNLLEQENVCLIRVSRNILVKLLKATKLILIKYAIFRYFITIAVNFYQEISNFTFRR